MNTTKYVLFVIAIMFLNYINTKLKKKNHSTINNRLFHFVNKEFFEIMSDPQLLTKYKHLIPTEESHLFMNKLKKKAVAYSLSKSNKKPVSAILSCPIDVYLDILDKENITSHDFLGFYDTNKGALLFNFMITQKNMQHKIFFFEELMKNVLYSQKEKVNYWLYPITDAFDWKVQSLYNLGFHQIPMKTKIGSQDTNVIFFRKYSPNTTRNVSRKYFVPSNLNN